MLELRADPRVWMQLGDISILGTQQQRRWLEGLDGDESKRYNVLFDDELDFIGIVRMDQIDMVNRSVRIGGDILPELQGRGYGQRMMKLLIEYCFAFLNMHRVWLLVLESNARARRLYVNAGLKEEGRQREAIFRDGAYHDYISMSLLRSERKRNLTDEA